MTKKHIFIGIGLVVVMGILVAGSIHIYNSVLAQSITGLNMRCQRSAKEEGINTVKLKHSFKLVNQHGSLTQACRIVLQNNASFEIDHSELATDKLVILAQESQNHTNELRITHSTMTSRTGGLLIRLQTKTSQVFISESKFDYPLSIIISTGSDEGTSKALLLAKNNTFKSVHKDSRGIGLISTGDGQYFGNRFELAQKDDFAYVVAVRCQAENNLNSSPRCQLN